MIKEVYYDDRYFEWLVNKIDHNGSATDYYYLLDYLYNKQFIWSIPLDENREVDGEKLREDYGWDGHFKGCNCLEMMIALAERCEHTIMGDPSGLDQSYKWFWYMIDNLGLNRFDDVHFKYDSVEDIVEDWLNHRYKSNGEGGLFPLKNPRKDQRTVEIWFQMCSWINENYDI
jgi:hypothetical protein